ncbi:phosphatidate cytidylyltransferase [Mameliella alba]|nr:phosphatidate cytidylyltransferase [Mameliella alba]MBY6169909.1 phosphatidate cytidylyltransferase [Mameliella alba]MBY6175114.1 phosphatidate cytidylyltransferase [Mameliella alba]
MKGRWRDLRARILSAIVLIGITTLAAVSGPLGFALWASVVTGLMIWELTRMVGPRHPGLPVVLGVIVALLIFGSARGIAAPWGGTDLGSAAVMAAVVALCLGLIVRRDRLLTVGYGFAVVLTGSICVGVPLSMVLLLVVLVALTDIAGYFAGKSIGGRKFWPSVSPNKTWAGIVAGWAAAGLLAIVLVLWFRAPFGFVLVALALSFASQMGDITESALKRRAGVKDSSNLIPGHGGFLDRLDGVVGASLALVFFVLVFDL